MKSLSCVRLLATPWTAAYQAPLSMGFSRHEYWSGVPLLSLVAGTSERKTEPHSEDTADLGSAASCAPSRLARSPRLVSSGLQFSLMKVWEPHASVFSAACLWPCTLFVDLDFLELMLLFSPSLQVSCEGDDK